MGRQKKLTVLSAWAGRLSAEKAAVYEPSVRELETGYSLMSFALVEGLQRTEAGELHGARKAAELCGALAERHAAVLYGALATMERRSRHFGTLPEVKPLDPATFRTETASTASFWSALLHRVLFSARQRWLHKLLTLQEILSSVRADFLRTAGELADGVSLEPVADWARLEEAHDDWNTCLRETTILLKCLVTTMAACEVAGLRRELEEIRTRAEEQPSEWTETRRRGARAGRREGNTRV